MKKKFLALVLTLTMVLSLVPVTALAADTPAGGASQGNTDNLTMKKTVTPVQNQDGTYQDGTYTVRLESYATGEVTNTSTTKSSDIVLLLDVSGSMSERYATKDTYSLYDGYNNHWLKYYSTTHWGLWYKTDANIYVPVSVDKEDNFGSSNDKYTYSYTKDGEKVIIEESTGRYTQPTTQFYYKTDATVTKMDALKEAVNAFIDDVAEKSPTSQISIVKFAGKESNVIGDGTYRDGPYTYNYTQVVKVLTQVNSSGATELKDAVSLLNAAGATSSDYGLNKAKDALKSAKQDKVIVLFTDGEPNHSDGFDYEVATTAVNTAKTLKQGKTTIYTVGVFENTTNDINQYMSSVSSNYPDASATVTGNGWKVTNGGSKVGEHYINAENAADLIKAFQTISSEVSSTPLNASAVVVDKVPSNFTAPASAENVTLKVADYQMGNTFGEERTATEGEGITATVKDGTVSVTGFDFSQNWCGLDSNKEPTGKKLIIEFTIKCTNYGGTQPTNAGAYIKASSESPEKIIDLKNPEVPVTVQLPKVNNPAVRTKTYDGAGFDIKDEIGKIIAGLVPVDGIKNKFIDLTYEIKDSTGKLVGTYTIPAGRTTGAWSSNEEIKTGSDADTYNYRITVIGQDKKQPNNKNSKECTATFTITKKEEVPYTLIFDANDGAWDIEEISGYTLNPEKNQATKSGLAASYQVDTSTVAEPKKENATFLGWGTRTKCFSNLALKPTVAVLKKWLNPENEGNTVTLYAVWKTEEAPDPAGNCTYTIRQHYWKNLNDTDTGDNVSIENLTAENGTTIADLINEKDKDQDWSGYRYLYDNQQTKVTVPGEKSTQLTNGAVLSVSGTVIDLYYYLDSWKDGNTQNPPVNDEKTGGDGTPDYKQILIEYKAHTPLVGEVSREFEIQTLEDNQTVATPTGAIAKAKKDSVYAFAYWIKGKVNPEKTEAEIENTAICYKNQLSGVTIDPVTGGGTYTYTAVFLKDVTGKIEEGKDKPDGIPDAWQYKVTFKVANGKWDDKTTADVVAYVTNKKNGTPCAKGTEGSKATLDGVTIPVAGSQPDSGYKASGNWDTTPSATTVINKEDTVFTYTYDKKSGGSGGSGGSNRPKPPVVEIPDDVPTGLNGKDHYAYVVGYPDGMVYPQKNITRAEVATIFFRLLTDETREANMTKSNGYNDMKDGAWYTCAVSTLSKMGIIKGYEDGSFKPDASISRAEFAAIAARFDPDGDKTPATFSDVSSHWAKDEISIAANHGWIKGYEDGSFKPDQKITRAETMTLVNRVLKRLPETKDDLHKDMKTWPDNQNESAWFYLAVQEATNSHYQKLKKDGTHETWESMRETRDWAALEK